MTETTASPDGTLERTPDGAVIHFERHLPYPIEAVWDAITCPVLVLRGERSDVLTRETAEEMTRRGPKAELVEFSGCGHAPSLMSEEQIRVVHEWLLSFVEEEVPDDAPGGGAISRP